MRSASSSFCSSVSVRLLYGFFPNLNSKSGHWEAEQDLTALLSHPQHSIQNSFIAINGDVGLSVPFLSLISDFKFQISFHGMGILLPILFFCFFLVLFCFTSCVGRTLKLAVSVNFIMSILVNNFCHALLLLPLVLSTIIYYHFPCHMSSMQIAQDFYIYLCNLLQTQFFQLCGKLILLFNSDQFFSAF